MLNHIIRSIFVSLSLLCVLASPAAFTPAVFFAFLLMTVSGLASASGHIKLGIVNLALTSVAISISPISDSEIFGQSILWAFLFIVPYIAGFGGALYGVAKLQNSNDS